jgi:hypothetical protein
MGNYLKALAKASMDKAVFPLTVFASLSTAEAILISELPPP